jgi:trk system potassium uptake protein TrkH
MRLNKHPTAVVAVKVDGKNISEQLERQTLVFIVMYVFTFFVTTLLLSLFGVDLFTSFSASIATLGNVGPGFGEVSSLANFDTLPAAAKFFLTINMFFGRLEIFSIIAFVSFRKRLF